MKDKPLVIFGIFNRERFLANINQLAFGVAAIFTFVAVRWGISLYLNLAYLPSPDKVVAAFFTSFEVTEASLGTICGEISLRACSALQLASFSPWRWHCLSV